MQHDAFEDEAEESWEDFADLAVDRAFKALAHPVRRFLVELLVFGSEPAGSLAASASATFGISTSRASQHLQVLAIAGLVDVWPDGPRRDYNLSERGLSVVRDWMAALKPERAADRGSG